MKADNTIITGLDIGSTHTTVVISELTDEGIHILGYAKQRSQGIRRGGVVNIDAVLKCVTATIEEAEQMAGQEVEGVVISVGGQQVEGKNSHGLVPVESRGRTMQKSEISQEDIARVMKAAGTVAIPLDREILHVMVQQYSVDETHEIKNPLGMLGVRLEADVHIVTCFASTVRNMIKAVNRAGFRVSKVLFGGIAAAETVLTKDERELGVLLIDFGGGTTTASIYKDEAPYFIASIPLGGIEISTDLSIMLKAPIDATEKLKCEYGSCQEFIGERNEPVLVPGVGGRPPLAVERHKIVEIAKPRVYELLGMIRDHIRDSGYESHIGGGAVLIGGGALLPGIAEATQEALGVSARIGQPRAYNVPSGYLSPDYSVAVGLVQSAANTYNFEDRGGARKGEGNKFMFIIKKWLRNFFE